MFQKCSTVEEVKTLGQILLCLFEADQENGDMLIELLIQSADSAFEAIEAYNDYKKLSTNLLVPR